MALTKFIHFTPTETAFVLQSDYPLVSALLIDPPIAREVQSRENSCDI